MVMSRRGEAWLTKAIGRVAILSTVLHVMRMILTSSSMSTGGWSEASGDVPGTLAAMDRTIENHYDPIHTSMVRSGIHTNDAGNDALVPLQQQQTPPPPQNDVHAPTRVRHIPLEELIDSSRRQSNVTCDPGNSSRSLIQSSTHHNGSSSSTMSSLRKIPSLIHVTAKTRCMTPAFRDNLDKWRFPGYGFYVHDEDAMDRLLAKYWPEFPHLQWIQQHCMITGAAKADLWRLLVLWEYGGIYTDIDNAPGKDFRNGTAIQEDDEAWFVVEELGILSQWFMAAEPRHPLIYISILILLERLLDVTNIREQYVPLVTGPGTLKVSMMKFLKGREEEEEPHVTAGKYVGMGNKTVTVVGRMGHAKDYILRGSVSRVHKREGYAAMGMSHFSSKKHKNHAPSDSCYEFLHRVAKEQLWIQSLYDKTDYRSQFWSTGIWRIYMNLPNKKRSNRYGMLLSWLHNTTAIYIQPKLFTMTTCMVDSECMNEGRCVRKNDADFYEPASSAGRYHTAGICLCKNGFSGSFCENGIGKSSCKRDVECFNGGTCRLASGERNQDRNDYLQNSKEVAHCVCANGFFGNTCQIRVYEGSSFTAADPPMEGKQVAGISVGVVLAVAVICFVFVKSIGGIPFIRRGEGTGRSPRISKTSIGLGKRRGTGVSNTTIEIGPVIGRNSTGEVL